MSHVFFRFWACDYKPCQEAIEHEGKTAHGWAWQGLAIVSEVACKDQSLLGLNLSSWRAESLAVELHKMEMKTLQRAELSERWGFEPGILEQVRKELGKKRK